MGRFQGLQTKTCLNGMGLCCFVKNLLVAKENKTSTIEWVDFTNMFGIYIVVFSVSSAFRSSMVGIWLFESLAF